MSPRHAGRIGLPALVLSLLVLLAGAPQARAQLGLGAGLNFSDLGDIDTGSADATFENSAGYHVGAFYRLGLGPLAIQPGVFYHQIGSYEIAGEGSFDLRAVEVPVDVQFDLLALPSVGAYLLAAPVLTFGRTDEGFDDAVEDLSLTGDIGFGVELSPPGAGLTLMPEIRYSVGVTDYLGDSFRFGDTTVQPSDDDRRLSKIMLRLNVAF
jgi:hypothetical protein